MLLALVLPLLLGVLAPVLPEPGAGAAQSSQRPSNQPETPFMLGVLRRDGVVLPFASFSGKDWDSRWPEDLRNVEVPLTLADVPDKWWGKVGPVVDFTVWADGRAQGTIKLERPVMVATPCARRIGVTSSYRTRDLPPPPFTRPYPKDGLVISGPQRIEALASIPLQSPEARSVVAAIVTSVDQAEQRAINAFTDWRHPLSREQRRQVPIELEAVYRAPMDANDWMAYHVEAVKRYAPGPADEGCGLVTSLTGWIGAGPKGKLWIALSARVTYCDRRGVNYFLPLGLMRLRDRIYWIFQSSNYEHERYFVVRPTKDETELNSAFTAGSCGGF